MTFAENCGLVRELISAQLDGETSDFENATLDSHVVQCAECTAVFQQLSAQHRQLRVYEAERVPDLAGSVMAKAHPPKLGRRGWIRQALAVLGLTELTLSLPALFFGDDANAPVHVARHVGSLSVALGFALVYAAWKPTRAYGMLPFIGALAACMVVSSTLDIALDNARLINEATHLVEFGAMYLVWLLAGSPRPRIPHNVFYQPTRGRQS
jgi:predicted anti-sigma-YlaC factor YlaD